jgi:FAD/FMN-containing dehydrogenase/Fe-S oxidoreductase
LKLDARIYGMKSLVQIQSKTPPAHLENRLQTGTTKTLTVDLESLKQSLSKHIKGEVRFSNADRGMYASDASNYRMIPLGVVLPKDSDDVVKTVEICRHHGAPIFARGGGTSIPGQTVNNGVLLDFSKYMNRIVELNPEEKYARVQPGVVLDNLRNEAENFRLTFGPDPATHDRCTLGGMIGNNSCGVHSVMAGETSDNIEELEILLYDGTRLTVGETNDADLEKIIAAGGRRGEIYRNLRDLRDKYADAIRRNFPPIRRRVSGYNLPALLPENNFNVARALVGSECTCAIVLDAKVKLIDSPRTRSLLVVGYSDIFTAADNVTAPMQFGPIALEALDDSFIEDMKKKQMHPRTRLMPEGGAWLLIEFGGESKEEADAKARKLMEHLSNGDKPPMKLFDDPKQEKIVWELREAGLGATAKIPGEPDNHEGWEDSAVPPEKLGSYLRDLKKLLDKYELYGSLYGHFGEGCVHTRLNFDLETAGGIERFRSFLEEASDLVVRHDGSLSGEHGDGQARGELLPRMYTDEILEAFREFKSIFDPDWMMNPGKLIAPYRLDEHLRLGPHFNPPVPETRFSYPDDRFNFVLATERCVGAGVCRRHNVGVMCPSYMVTLEEKHSTRGRARLLGEMIRGEVVKEGWQSEAVKDALDLCLACKGCKGECPVQVDMATYKAEFLSHYYAKHFRPRAAFTMGKIHRWARLASRMPSVANFLTHAPILAPISRFVAGVHSNRTIPRFAPQTFTTWFRRRTPKSEIADQKSVLLWADTFSNFFYPQIAQAAVRVLEAAGFRVEVPGGNLCCGRPLYDWGMLDEARQLLREILDTLRLPIENGIPVVVLEPSCASVFHEELINFFPNDENAKRLNVQTFSLAEFLQRNDVELDLPKFPGQALLHGHCHHKSIRKMESDDAILQKMGVDFEIPDSGCCGMAGAFGFEKQHFEVSLKCGERVLLPAIRKLEEDAFVIADGFSCREQVRQATGRRPLHLAEFLQMALTQKGDKR